MIKRVLIVDDNSTNLYMLESLLKGYGLEVTTAENGKDALEKARLNPPDLIVTDILMPVMDGYALCREWKSDDTLKQIPLVFYTATYTESKDEEFALSLGADRFIIKPQEPDAFMTMLQGVFGKKYAARQVVNKPLGEEMEFFRRHNEILFGKLEKKVLDLEIANQKLKMLEERYRLSFENVSDVIYMIDAEYNIVNVSPSVKKIVGYEPEELMGRSVDIMKKILTPESLEQAAADISTVLKGGTIHSSVYEFITMTGERKFGEVSGSPIMRDGEVAGLISVGRDITARKNIEKALEESEKRYRELVRYAPAGIYEVDYETGRFTSVNDVICQYTGYTRDELLTMNLFDMLTDESRQVMVERLEKLYAEKEETGLVEYCIRKKEGGELWALLQARYRYDAGKLKGATGVIYDITERRQAEEKIEKSLREKESMLREIHHRVNNNMQVIASMLSLQSDAIREEGILSILKETESRVKSMALIHEKLYLSPDLSEVNFGEYIASLAMHLLAVHKTDPALISIVSHKTDISFEIETAIPCGLIVNELITNALKHAFPEGMKGEIAVDLRRNPDETLTLTVSDNGIGLPEEIDPFRAKTFGMQLVGIFTEQLDGTLEIVRGEGTTFSITFRELQYRKRR